MNWLKNMGRRIHWCLLAMRCPKFYESMPKEDKPGTWVACAMRTNPFSGRRGIYTEEVEGLLNAYIKARELALKLDWETPYADGELGVDWGVRKPRKEGVDE